MVGHGRCGLSGWNNYYIINVCLMIPINTQLPIAIGFVDSRQGGRAENQDTCGYADTPLGLLVVVCDGMGGDLRARLLRLLLLM